MVSLRRFTKFTALSTSANCSGFKEVAVRRRHVLLLHAWTYKSCNAAYRFDGAFDILVPLGQRPRPDRRKAKQMPTSSSPSCEPNGARRKLHLRLRTVLLSCAFAVSWITAISTQATCSCTACPQSMRTQQEWTLPLQLRPSEERTTVTGLLRYCLAEHALESNTVSDVCQYCQAPLHKTQTQHLTSPDCNQALSLY